MRSIALFGSYVRDEQREDSDIDFLVEFEKNTYSNFINFVYSLEELFDKKVTVVSEDDLSPYIKPYVMKELEPMSGFGGQAFVCAFRLSFSLRNVFSPSLVSPILSNRERREISRFNTPCNSVIL